KNLSQNVVHSDSDLILHNSSVLIDKEPKKDKDITSRKNVLKISLPFCIISILNNQSQHIN
ncbi:hypothetical protein DVW80_14655, partial [Enterococcus faecium]